VKLFVSDHLIDFIYETEEEEKYFKKLYVYEDTSLVFSRGAYDASLIKKVNFIRKHKEHNFMYSGFLVDFLKHCKRNKFEIKIDNKLSKIGHLDKEFTKEKISKLFPFDYNIHQVEAMEKLLKVRSGIVKAVTSAGKSYIMANFIKLTKLPTLVLVNKVTLCDQLAATISEVCGIKCGVWHGKKKQMGDVVVATIGSINTMPDINNFKVLCGDELHNFGAESFQKFLKERQFPIKIGFSATPRKDELQFQKIRQFFGDVIVEIGAEQLMDAGVVITPEIKFVEVKCTPTMDWPTAYQKGIVENKERNNAIVKIVEKHHIPTLIIIKDVMNGHGDLLKQKIQALGRKVEFISGESKDRQEHIEALDAGKIDVLIATGILNEGISIRNVHMLIMASGGKALTETSQKIGRALRKMDGKEKALIIEFSDKGNKYTQSHATQRKHIYQSIGFRDIEDVKLEEFLKR
jgi:superfamily II DNA or RNA helicase